MVSMFLWVHEKCSLLYSCHRLSPTLKLHRGGSLWGQICKLVHRAAVAPMQNATGRAQEMHFEYKNVTSCRRLAPLTRGSASGPRCSGGSAPRPPLRLRNDVYCVGWDVKLYSLTPDPRYNPRYGLALRACHGSLQNSTHHCAVPY